MSSPRSSSYAFVTSNPCSPLHVGQGEAADSIRMQQLEQAMAMEDQFGTFSLNAEGKQAHKAEDEDWAFSTPTSPIAVTQPVNNVWHYGKAVSRPTHNAARFTCGIVCHYIVSCFCSSSHV